MLNGLSTINVELTSRCNKQCWMCGRRKTERDHPEIAEKRGDMDFSLVEDIAAQLPPGIVVQLHNNGEPLLYPRFGEAVKLFGRQITSITTNGKLLCEKAAEIIGNLDTLAVSVVQDDPEAESQKYILGRFLELKRDKKPLVVLRLLGEVCAKDYEYLGCTIATRILHSPMGSVAYERTPAVPEIGVCLDFLHHPAIDRNGEMSVCVRFDPQRRGVLGYVTKQTIGEIWNGARRLRWLHFHVQGRRKMVPLCSSCDYWGVPTGRS